MKQLLLLTFAFFFLFTESALAQLDSKSGAPGGRKVYTYVEKMPTFRGGGTDSVISYLRTTLRYPPEASSQRIEGKTFIRFVVDTSGTVGEVEVAKSAHPLLDAEALRVIRIMPAWEPGMQYGKPANVAFTVPIGFRLPPLSAASVSAATQSASALAAFPGGPQALRAYLSAAPYPEAARASGAEGRVFVSFEISPTGSVGNVRTIAPNRTGRSKSAGPAALPLTSNRTLAKAAEALIAAMPAWQPATRNGAAVMSKQTVPVDFYLAPPTTAPAAVYAYADQMPVFAGSTPFPESLFRTIRYPPEALRNHIQGNGLLYFVVNEQGQIEQTEFIQSVHPILDQEVLHALGTQRVVAPARLQGQPVKVFYVLPLNFGIR